MACGRRKPEAGDGRSYSRGKVRQDGIRTEEGTREKGGRESRVARVEGAGEGECEEGRESRRGQGQIPAVSPFHQ